MMNGKSIDQEGMRTRGLKYRSFQVKVLVPVITFLVATLAVSTWLVTRQFRREVEEDSRQALTTAEAVFQNSLQIRARNLVLRFNNIVNEPRFKAVAQLGEPRTMKAELAELLGEMESDVEATMFTTNSGSLLAFASRNPGLDPAAIRRGNGKAVRLALEGEAVSDTIVAGSHLYNVISAPVALETTPLGVLTVAVRIDESAARELKSLTRSEIVFLARGRVLASTISDPQLDPVLLRAFGTLTAGSRRRPQERMMQVTTEQGEHFICLPGLFEGGPAGDRFGYVLLSSYQHALLLMRSAQRALWLVALFGILSSSVLIAVLIRRITYPLRLLRDSAEAVGQGDLSRRVQVVSNDECGELGNVFNRMMDRLSRSRAETERALETLQKTQAQLIQKEKLSAIGEFAAGVTHELNNPLTAVLGYSEILLDGEMSEAQSRLINGIVESAQRCHRIVQNLLGFVRQRPPERKAVDIHRLIDDAIEILNYEMRIGNIEIHRHFSPVVPGFMGDRHQLQQAFLNILNNARQAVEGCRNSGNITIATQVTERKMRIIFEDDGPGIDMQDRDKIFDPFFTTKPLGQGTGLGLSLCYGIVRKHGGTIFAESPPEGGAKFVVELPLNEAASGTRPVPTGAVRPAARLHSGKRVLVIDDEEPILEVLREALSCAGHQVEAFRTGPEAIERCRTDRHELILCDWRMPGMGGEEVFRRICEIRPDAWRRFIFMTGDLLNPGKHRLLGNHDITWLLKPFTRQELYATVDSMLEKLGP